MGVALAMPALQAQAIDDQQIAEHMKSNTILRLKQNIQSGSIKLKKYGLMFDPQYKPLRYLHDIRGLKERILMAKFRTGSHWLQVQRGRFEGQPRSERIFKRCHSEVDDDEHIFVFECPALLAVRQSFPGLFVSATDLRTCKPQKPNLVVKIISRRAGS